MNQPDLLRKKLPRVLQILYRPMLFVSLGLHGLFLMLPMPQSTEPKVEQKPNEQLEITSLLAPPKKLSPQPSIQTTRPQTQRTTPPLQRRVAPPRILQPTPSPSIAPTPQATPTPTPFASPTPLPSPEKSPIPEPTPEASVTSEAENAEFQNLFGDVAGEVSEELGVDPSYFAQPELFFTPESLNSDEPQQKPEIARIKWISLKTPEQVFGENLEPQLQSSGLQISPEDEYGGGKVYKLQKGNFVKYLNLVPTATSIGTLVVIWNEEPQTNQ